jgi:hypothetical protein
MSRKELVMNQQILIMAFRYALNRNTAAPGEVCQVLKQYWSELDDWVKEQVESDIDREIRIKRSETSYYNKVSNDFIDMSKWIKSNK